MLIKGNTGTYLFDPVSKGSVLRASGKFGSTYIGKRAEDNLAVVIKKLNPALGKDTKAVARFRREAQIRVHHPGLVKAIEYFMDEGGHYLVREFVPGMDLKSYSAKKKIPVSFFIKCGIQAAEALGALHAAGIVHRDVRPANILVSPTAAGEPFVKIIDLGMARTPADDSNEKSPFALIYSPPEQVMNCGPAVNATSDLYSLAVSLYECITGQVPFYHANPEMMMHLQLVKPLEPHKRIPPALLEVWRKAASKYNFPLPPNKYKREELLKLMLIGQKDRYTSADEFVKALQTVLHAGPPPQKKFWKKITGR